MKKCRVQSIGVNDKDFQEEFKFFDVVEFRICQRQKSRWDHPANSKAIKQISEWSIYCFDFRLTPIGNILRQIQHINFPVLKTLAIWADLREIQGITNINMPSLKSVWLGANQIVWTRSLRKGSWKKLKILRLACNPSQDTHTLVSLRLKECTELSLPRNTLSDVSWVAKLDSTSLESLSLYEKDQYVQQIDLKKWKSKMLLKHDKIQINYI